MIRFLLYVLLAFLVFAFIPIWLIVAVAVYLLWKELRNDYPSRRRH